MPDWRDDAEFVAAMRAKYGDKYVDGAIQRGASGDGTWKEMAWAHVGWKARAKAEGEAGG